MARLSDFFPLARFLLLFGFIGWMALGVGATCWWWAVEIFARDAIFIPYPLLSDTPNTSHQYALVGFVFTLLGFEILVATWDLAKDKEVAPEHYLLPLNGLTWVIGKVIRLSMAGLFLWFLKAYFFDLDVPVVELRPGAKVFVLLMVAIWLLNWDVRQDQKAAEGKYAIPGQSLMSDPDTRLFVLSVITLVAFFGMAEAEPRSLLYLRANAETFGIMSDVQKRLASWAEAKGRLPKDQAELQSLEKAAFGGPRKGPYQHGKKGEAVYTKLSYVRNASGPYIPKTGPLEPSVVFCAVDESLKKLWLTATILDGYVGHQGTPLLDLNDFAKPAVYSNAF